MLSTAIRNWSVKVLLLALFVLPRSAAAAPPANSWLFWQSNRLDARSELYRARADGTEIVRLTKTGGLFPQVAPDGRWIGFHDQSGASYLMRPDGSELKTLPVGRPWFWLHDNSGVALLDGSNLYLLDPETLETTPLASAGDFPQLAGASFGPNSMTQDNRYLLLGSDLYINGYSGTNGSFTSDFSAVIVDMLHKDRVYYFGSGCWPIAAPAGDMVYHVCANCPTHPDLYHMHAADLDTRSSYAPEVANIDTDWGHEYNPRVSNDNRWLAYMASSGCHDGEDCDYDIWVHELGAGPTERTHVIQDPANDAYPQLFVGSLWQNVSQPRLLLTPWKMTFFAGADSPLAAKTVKIKNSGGGTLGVAVVTTDPGAPWLDVQTDGTNTITFALRGDFITQGTYQTTVTVTVDGALGSPASVPVVLFADETFPISDAGVAVLAEPDGGGSAVLDAALATAVDANGEATEATKAGSGCGCAVGGVPHVHGIITLLVLVMLFWRRKRSQCLPIRRA
jgi:MYXO-CTERM domain-containing protein